MTDSEEYFPKSKKPRISDANLGRCWLCEDKFVKKEDIRHADQDNIKRLFESIRSAKDNHQLLSKLARQENDILTGKISVKYHRNCRSKYVLIKQEPSTSGNQEKVRTKRSGFNFKDNCFVCGKPCHKGHKNSSKYGWSLISGKDSAIYDQVYTAAERIGDNEMILRLTGIPHKDLVAADCRYHRGKKMCLSYYINRVGHIEKPKRVKSLIKSSEEKSSEEKSSEERSSDNTNILLETPGPSGAIPILTKNNTLYEAISILRTDIAETFKIQNKKDLNIQTHQT